MRGKNLCALGRVFLGLWLAVGAIPTHANEAGFITIEPVDFYFQAGGWFDRLPLRSSEARLWYVFQPAEDHPQNRPLFVFFNGGPGSSTSCGLLSMYTSEFTLDNTQPRGGSEFIINPTSWTGLGNLLHIDARQSGFSYNLMPGVEDMGARFREFNAQNFNTFFDGADFIRLLLRFYDGHPELRDNPVVIVGESYGGGRATAMLHLLLNYTDYGDGSEVYQDPALAAELQAHFERVFPAYSGNVVPPEVIAGQFGHQILIQPTLSSRYQGEVAREMFIQPGSVIHQLAADAGVVFDAGYHQSPFSFVYDVVGRDIYNFSQPSDWLFEYFFKAAELLQSSASLARITGVDITGIPEMYAAVRGNAYRVYDSSDLDAPAAPAVLDHDDIQFRHLSRVEAARGSDGSSDLESVFGTLQPWDRYFISSNSAANYAFHYYSLALARGYDVHYSEPRFGRMFLKNTAFVNTFVTNAAYDLVIYSPAIPPALARHDEILEQVIHDRNPMGEEARPGRIELHYRDDAFPDVSAPGVREIRFPYYSKSCHAVSLTEPQAFFEDVAGWLAAHGLDLRSQGGLR